MSKGTNLICECGGKIRVTESHEGPQRKKEKGRKQKILLNKQLRNPGINRIGQNYWYCTSCGKDEHILEEVPEWGTIIPYTEAMAVEEEVLHGN